MADQVARKTDGMSRRMKVLLVVSLSLNLLIVGTIGGAMFTHSKWRSHHPPRLDLSVAPLTKSLTRKDRRAIGRQMRKEYRESGADRFDPKAEYGALVSDLKADPFDAEMVKQRLERQRAFFGGRLELGQSLLLERLTEMDPAEREAFADRLQENLERRGSSRKRKRD